MIVQYDNVNVISANLVYCLKQIPSEDNSGEPYKMVFDVSFTYTVEEKQ